MNSKVSYQLFNELKMADLAQNKFWFDIKFSEAIGFQK